MSSISTQLFISTILTIISVPGRYNTFCDDSTTGVVREGNLGQTSVFSWLGVFRITLYNRDPQHPEIALTGVVLIKREYVLINAHDVSSVPLYRLKENGRVMFFADTEVPWYCKPKSYHVHPEYGPITRNTVAVLQLDLDEATDYPLRPICWSSRPLNTSTFLYVAGYTDENKLLEKVIYKVQYTEKTACSEFYNRAKLAERSRTPVYYVCAHAASKKTHCIWDNGMVLISNASEYFSLIGFGTQGPGCAAPARFINLQHYYEWMEDVTTDKYEYDDYRRDGEIEEIPLHSLFRNKPMLRQDENVTVSKSLDMPHSLYHADVESPRYFNIDEEEKGAISVFPFNETFEAYDNACSSWRTLMYREYFELNAKDRTGSAVYKISLYDLLINRCTCVKIIMDTESHSTAILSIKEQIDLNEGEALTSSEEMYDNLFKINPIKELYTREPPAKGAPWKPGPHMKPVFIEEYFGIREVPNYILYIRFEIKDKAIMKIEMYGEPHEIKINLTTTTIKTITTTTTTAKISTLTKEEEKAEIRKQRIKPGMMPSQARNNNNKLTSTKLIKSGWVKGFPDSSIRTHFGKALKPISKTMTTLKASKLQRFFKPDFSEPLSTKNIRDSAKYYNITRLWPKKGSRKKVTPALIKSTNLHSTRRRGKNKKVRLQKQTLFATSTPYPTALVETVSSVAGSPKSIAAIQSTLIKVILFDVFLSILNL